MAEHIVQAGKDIDSVTEYLKYGDTVIVEDGEYDAVAVKVSGVTYRARNPRKAITGKWYFHTGASDNKFVGFDALGAFLLENANKNNLIQNCEIHHSGTLGVDLTSGSDGNIVEDCLIYGMHYAYHTSGESGCKDNIFRRNHCYNHSDALNISPLVYNTKVYNNVIHDCEDDGIHLFDKGQAEVIGNLVYNCRGVPLWTTGSGGIITKYNTVIGTSETLEPQFAVFYLEGSGHIVNYNIFYADTPNLKLLLKEGSGNIDYNNWYNPQNPMQPIGVNGMAIDPKFVDIANNDYRLRTDSPCIGWGYIYEGGGEMNWNVTGVDFVATFKQGSIEGKVTKDGMGLEAVNVEITGDATTSVLTNDEGLYKVVGLSSGVYKVTPKSEVYDFTPIGVNVSIPTE